MAALLKKFDVHDTASRHPYYITFTSAVPFPEDFASSLAEWHIKKCESVLLVQEGGDGGEKHLHYHSVGTFKTKITSNVTSQCQTLYKKHKLGWSKNAVKVKTVSCLVGLFHYLLKEKSNDEKPLLVMGWKLTWIKEQMLTNLKKMPHCLLLKDIYTISPKTATRIITEYASIKSIHITCKESFMDVCDMMVEDGYDFVNVMSRLKVIYGQVMSRLGYKTPLRDAMNDALFGVS